MTRAGALLLILCAIAFWGAVAVHSLVKDRSPSVEPLPEYEQLESVDSADLDESSGQLKAGRSGKWRSVRAEHLKVQPRCLACDSTENLNVHHLIPFPVDPDRENDPSNLATFCRDHHYGIAHDPDGDGPEKPSWSAYNKNAVDDAFKYRRKHNLPEYTYGGK